MQEKPALLKQQQTIIDTIKVHATQGGFSVIIGEPGVGKTSLKQHIENWHNERDTSVVSVSRTVDYQINTVRSGLFQPNCYRTLGASVFN